MVRLVHLDEDVDPPDEAGALPTSPASTQDRTGQQAVNNEPFNPNLNQFSAALSCYPIVSQLAYYLDLTALHELSRTCRQVRANLLQHRTQLIAHTLRCENERTSPAQQLSQALHASHAVWTTYGRDGVKNGRMTSGKVGACARDMVGECRRCGKIVCRNCIIKTPPTAALKGRHRRLCRTCMKSPLDRLTTVSIPQQPGADPNPAVLISHSYPSSSSSSSSSFPSSSPSPSNPHPSYPSTLPTTSTDTSPALLLSRGPCSCESAGPWLCQPCGTGLRPADTTYLRGWTWRTRYSACGGFGAGLGEGNEGVECGRMRHCLAARTVEKEIECDAADLAALEARAADERWRVGWAGPTTATATTTSRCWEGSSYATQEIVGIGGKVKKKVRQRVPVGAIVKEYEDERVSEVFLGREQQGANRSWCSWCERVVLGKKDVDAVAGSRESVGSTSSIASSV